MYLKFKLHNILPTVSPALKKMYNYINCKNVLKLTKLYKLNIKV